MQSQHSARDPAASNLEMAQLKRLRIASVVETTTLMLLAAVAVPLKHFAGQDVVVRIVGPVHGLAFASYLWIALQTVSGPDWKRGDVVRLFAAAVVPFGGVLAFRAVGSRMARLRGRAVP